SGIVKNAPAPNAAKLFMEYLLSREGNEVVVSQYQDPVNKHVKSMAGGKSIAEVKTIRPSLTEIEKSIPEVKELFRETFGMGARRRDPGDDGEPRARGDGGGQAAGAAPRLEHARLGAPRSHAAGPRGEPARPLALDELPAPGHRRVHPREL